YWYENNRNSIDLPLIWQQRVITLNRFGAPHDVYLLNDLLEGRLPEYKLYVFLNPFHLNDHRRQALHQALGKGGKTALWLYAPGLCAAMEFGVRGHAQPAPAAPAWHRPARGGAPVQRRRRRAVRYAGIAGSAHGFRRAADLQAAGQGGSGVRPVPQPTARARRRPVLRRAAAGLHRPVLHRPGRSAEYVKYKTQRV